MRRRSMDTPYAECGDGVCGDSEGGGGESCRYWLELESSEDFTGYYLEPGTYLRLGDGSGACVGLFEQEEYFDPDYDY